MPELIECLSEAEEVSSCVDTHILCLIFALSYFASLFLWRSLSSLQLVLGIFQFLDFKPRQDQKKSLENANKNNQAVKYKIEKKVNTGGVCVCVIMCALCWYV